MLIIVAAIILRIILAPLVFHGDTLIQASWGQIIQNQGAKGFYEGSYWTYISPNQPPLITLVYSWGFKVYLGLNNIFIRSGLFISKHNLGADQIKWWYGFINWWDKAKYAATPFKWGELISMKLFPIFGDGILAAIIYHIVSKLTDKKKAMWAVIIYLFSPFSWYESALWGQHDQLGLIFLLAAFLLAASDKYEVMAPLMMVISIVLKPTALMFGPLLVWVVIKNPQKMLKTAMGSLIALVAYYSLTRIFSNLTMYAFNENLVRQMFDKGEMMTWANTFNLWRIVTGYLTNYQQLFLGITLKTWGYILFAGVNVMAIKISWRRDLESILKGIFVVGFGGWMTMVTMHDRYLFTAIVVGLILAFTNNKLWKYWWIMSIIFWINMFMEWWYPGWMNWLKIVLTWGKPMDGIVPKILAVINLMLFIKTTNLIWDSGKMGNGLQTSITTKTLRKTWQDRDKK